MYLYPVSDWLLLLLRGRGRDEMCEVLSELVGTKVERVGITRLVTKQSTSSSSLRHDTVVWGFRNVGQGNEKCSLPCGYNYIWRREIL